MEFRAFRERARAELKRIGRSQTWLGKQLKPPVHRNTIHRWLEVGGAIPDFRQFMQIARALGVAGRYLSGASEDRRPPLYPDDDAREFLEAYEQQDAAGRAALKSILSEAAKAIRDARRR